MKRKTANFDLSAWEDIKKSFAIFSYCWIACRDDVRSENLGGQYVIQKNKKLQAKFVRNII